MPNQLLDLANTNEHLKGPNLIRTLSLGVLGALVVGLIIGYFMPSKLNQPEQPVKQGNTTTDPTKMLYATFSGIVTYMGENYYPSDDIKYALTDKKGDVIVMLKASDAKLSIAEGLVVKVSGRREKTANGKDEYLSVESLTINSVSKQK